MFFIYYFQSNFRCLMVVSIMLVVKLWIMNVFKLTGPVRCGRNLKNVTEQMLRIKSISTSCETAFRWIPQYTFDNTLTLVHAIAWCHLSANHHLSQCWTRSILPYQTTMSSPELCVTCYKHYIHNQIVDFKHISHNSDDCHPPCNIRRVT